MKKRSFGWLCATLLLTWASGSFAPAFAWDKTGHQYINRAAAMAFPGDMPAFMRTPETIDAIAYLGPEPDRWGTLGGSELRDTLRPEHYILMELADLAGPLPRTRPEYLRNLTAAQILHPDRAADLTPYRVGLQPYSAIEVYGRLLAAMREYRRLNAAHENTKPVELAITFYAGWLGHYVGDGANPMHTSINYNGWVQDNPDGYTPVGHDVHGEWENLYVPANIKPDSFVSLISKPRVLNDVFTDYVAYLRGSNALVGKTYEIEKQGGFKGAGSPEAHQFTDERFAAAASMLRDIIYTAWVNSASPPAGKNIPTIQAPPR